MCLTYCHGGWRFQPKVASSLKNPCIPCIFLMLDAQSLLHSLNSHLLLVDDVYPSHVNLCQHACSVDGICMFNRIQFSLHVFGSGNVCRYFPESLLGLGFASHPHGNDTEVKAPYVKRHFSIL